MRIAVLCPGPSLTRYWGLDRRWCEPWDLVVAVNAAGWLYACDWLVFADKAIKQPILDGEADPPRVGYVTHPRTPLPSQAARRELPLRNVRCKFGALLPRGEDGISCAFTFPNALAYANGLMRSPVEVHVFGFDCDPSPHGVALEGGNHQLSRWVSELPWIAHCWTRHTHVHSELPQPVRRWLAMCADGAAGRLEWDQAIECLRSRCEVAKA